MATATSDLIFQQSDLFEETEEAKSNVHVRVQQRTGRKCVTTVQGLANDLDLKKILKYVKKVSVKSDYPCTKETRFSFFCVLFIMCDRCTTRMGQLL